MKDFAGKNNVDVLDYLKGIAILSVIFMHSVDRDYLYSIYQELWVGQAVPIFLTITFFLAFRKLSKSSNPIRTWFSKEHVKKTCQRIFPPFLAVTILQICILLLCGRNDLIMNMLYGGGYGPGKYYIWVYIQLWIIAPFLYVILNRNNRWLGVLFVLLICVILNVICSILDVESYGYIFWADLCVRYVFLSAIAFILLHKEDFNKFWLLIFAVFSVVYLEKFRFIDFEPWVYAPRSWSTQNYPAFFYTLLVIVVLMRIHEWICSKCNLKFIYWLGKNSWEIFLFQMAIIGFARSVNMHGDNHNWCHVIVNLLIAYSLSILPVLFLRKIEKKSRTAND